MTERSAPRRGSSLTVAGWQTLVLAIMGVLVLAGAVVGTALLTNYDRVSHELIDGVQPARSAAYRLQAALRDQETSIRGYAISANEEFLDPYRDGKTAEATAADEIRQRAGSRSDLVGDVDAIEQASTAWRASFAEPLIASITPGSPRVTDPAVADRGRVEFDGLRQLFDRQNQHLADARSASIANLDDVRTWRNVVLIGIFVALVVTAAVLALVMRSTVTRPLAALTASCRRITEGDFTARITPQGPKDIRAIAVDVENMRQRIVDELESTRATGALLDEQTVELRRSNAELEQFAYVASHDLQEPLRKVTAFCQLIEKRYGDQLDERGIEYIAFAVDGAKRMQVLINDLLTFSRVGRLNTAQAEVELDTTLDAALGNLSVAISETGAEIVRTGEPLPRIIGDPTLLAMLWQNLIGNATKFHHDGVAPRIRIECQRAGGDGAGAADVWVFALSDNGIGIAADFVDKVFVIFQRLHGRDAYGGTGIGLALCKKIVEHHGGEIWIDTSYTGGTRFVFTLPMSVPEPPDAASDDEPAALLEGTS